MSPAERIARIVTTTSLVLGVLCSALWPWYVGKVPPQGAKAAEKLQFLKNALTVGGGALFFFIVAALGSIIILRIARKEFFAERSKNIRTLIVGTQEDIQKKQNES